MNTRARRANLILLCLSGTLLLLGVSYLGYLAWMKNGAAPGNSLPPDAPVGSPNTGVQPSKYPARKFAFICDISPAIHLRINRFLPVALSSFGKQQKVDVMVTTSDDKFMSVTDGLIPMTTTAQAAAWEAVRRGPDGSSSTFLSALKTAEDEKVEAVYLLTSADQMKQFGPDPLAMFTQITHGRKVQLNCVIFASETDSKEDLEKWKKLADGTHGAYLLRKSASEIRIPKPESPNQ